MHDSGFGRLITVLLAPAKTFRSIGERPTWLAPLLVGMVLTGAVGLLVMQKGDMEEMIRTRIEESGREVPAEAIEQQVEFMERFGWIFGLFGVLVVPVINVIVAALFLGVFKLLGSDLDFKQSFSTYLYGTVPMLVAAVLGLPLLFARESLTMEELQAGGVLMSNLGFLAPEDAGAALRAALTSLDLFSFWSIVLLAIGYRVVGRVSAGAAAGTVVGLWLVYVLGKIGWAALFG
jgi:hypothetical protein